MNSGPREKTGIATFFAQPIRDNPYELSARRRWKVGDPDYDEEGSFVRHAYFPGADDPCKLHSGRFAVKAINHLGDEVLKVLRVS